MVFVFAFLSFQFLLFFWPISHVVYVICHSALRYKGSGVSAINCSIIKTALWPTCMYGANDKFGSISSEFPVRNMHIFM